MRYLTRALCLVVPMSLMAVVAVTASATETLWSIGQKDGSYVEFAVAGSHADYSAKFPQDAAFLVGRSDPAQKWPFIHPGPNDPWAGSKSHTFQIDFKLRRVPSTACRLSIYAVDTHSLGAPVLEVRVNDGAPIRMVFPTGAGDSSLKAPRAGRNSSRCIAIPQSDFRAGKNSISLTSVDGSWLLYDAVVLETLDDAGVNIASFDAACTPFFREIDGQLQQAVRVNVDNIGLEGDGELALADGGSAERVSIQQSGNTLYLLVPPFEKAEKKRTVLKAGGKTFETEFDAVPARRWTIFVAPSAHTDIGYTDLQEKIFLRHNDNNREALAACEAEPEFAWNLEVFAQLDWFRRESDRIFEHLEFQIRKGRIGLTGLYLNMLTGLCNGEEMVRVLEPAQDFARMRRGSVLTATLTDVPTAVGTLPMLLKQAGIRYFAEGINDDRGPVWFHSDKRMFQSPFWWEALDGSRVLAIFTKSYGQAHVIGLRADVPTLEDRLPGWIAKIDRPDYPCDAIYGNGAFWDNEAVTPHFVQVAKEWNARWAFPRIIISRPHQFFQYVENKFGKDLPVFRGDMGVYWEDGAGSSALETGIARRAKPVLARAELWHTLAAAHRPGWVYPKDNIDEAWKNVIYYDEHTWGAAGSISQPQGEQTVKQWEYKAAYARQAGERAVPLADGPEERGPFRALVGETRGEEKGAHHVTACNEMGWKRDMLMGVDTAVPDMIVKDSVTGTEVEAQEAGGRTLFLAKNVPSAGYRTYVMVPGKRGVASPPLLKPGADPYTWESPRFRFRIDAATGALASVQDVRTGREWVDASSGYGINQFLYVLGGNGTSLVHPGAPAAPALEPITHTKAEVTLVDNGPLTAILRVVRTGDKVVSGVKTPSVETQYIIRYDGRIDIDNKVIKDPVLEKEAGYFAFPVKLDAPDRARVLFELPYGIVEADREQPAGACREWYAANTFAAVADDRIAAYLATRESPLFTVGNMVRGAWPAKVENNRGTIFAYVFNNYWHTNYKASQGGEIPFSFSLRLDESRFDPVAATRFGWERFASETTLCDRYKLNTTFRPFQGSFVEMKDGPVLLSEFRQRDGRILARFYNPSYKDASTWLRLPGLRIAYAEKTDLVGRPEKTLSVRGNEIGVDVRARSIATVMLDAHP